MKTNWELTGMAVDVPFRVALVDVRIGTDHLSFAYHSLFYHLTPRVKLRSVVRVDGQLFP